MRDFGTKVNNLPNDPTGVLDAVEFNDIGSEFSSLLTSAGITPSSGDLSQLGKALAVYASIGNVYVDTGSANAYVLAAGSPRKQIPALINQQIFCFIPGADNTTTSTVNVASIGVKTIKTPAGSNLSAGMIKANRICFIQYNSAAGGTFTLLPYLYSTEDATVTADWTFSGVVPKVTSDPSTGNMLVRKSYLDSAIAAISTFVPAGHINGLKLAWATNDTITVSAGTCMDSTDAAMMTLASPVTVDISVNGAINRLDTGTQANSTWYFVWLCSGGSGTGAVFSTSSTAPTLPTGYTTYKRLIGAVYNSSGGNILEFFQIGKKNDRQFIWSVYRAIVTGGNPGNNTWVSTSTSGAFIPTAITTTMLLHAEGYSGGAGNGNVDALQLRTKGTTNVTYNTVVSSATGYSGSGAMDVRMKTDSSGDFDYERLGTQTGFLVDLWANGFILEV